MKHLKTYENLNISEYQGMFTKRESLDEMFIFVEHVTETPTYNRIKGDTFQFLLGDTKLLTFSINDFSDYSHDNFAKLKFLTPQEFFEQHKKYCIALYQYIKNTKKEPLYTKLFDALKSIKNLEQEIEMNKYNI